MISNDDKKSAFKFLLIFLSLLLLLLLIVFKLEFLLLVLLPLFSIINRKPSGEAMIISEIKKSENNLI
jgi:hypothetical protein